MQRCSYTVRLFFNLLNCYFLRQDVSFYGESTSASFYRVRDWVQEWKLLRKIPTVWPLKSYPFLSYLPSDDTVYDTETAIDFYFSDKYTDRCVWP